MRTLERMISYLCLAVVLTLGIVWGVFDTWVPKQADLSRVLGFILGLMALATVYTWTRYAEVQRSLADLRGQVAQLVSRTGQLSDSLDVHLSPMDFKKAFEVAARRCPTPSRVRIRAVTSQMIQQAIFNHDFTIGKCDVVVYQPPKGALKETERTIRSVLGDWKARYARNGIGDLEIRRYPHLPTEYEIIFDDQLVLWGMYIADPADRSGVRFTKATLVGASSADKREVIRDFIERFDSLFATAQLDYSSLDVPSATSRQAV